MMIEHPYHRPVRNFLCAHRSPKGEQMCHSTCRETAMHHQLRPAFVCSSLRM